MSSAGAAVAGEEASRGTKRSPDEQQENREATNPEISPPTLKNAKLNPPAGDDGEKGGSRAAPAATAQPTASVTSATPQGAGPTDSERVEAEALSSLGLGVGTRLEVMWLLEDDDKSVEKWWGCSIAGAKTGERDEDEGRPVFTLHYDAYEAFEEADHDVSFVDRYRLVHLEDGSEMTWKREGEEVDREAVLASLADEDVDLQEVMAAQEEEEPGDGAESIETQGMNALAQLPHHQQPTMEGVLSPSQTEVAMAAGYRRMADVVKEHLRAKMQSGGGAVVSAADVENMFRDVRGGGGSGGGGRAT